MKLNNFLKLNDPDEAPENIAIIAYLLTFFHRFKYTISMAQDYDNIGKKLWADHAEDLSRFVLDTGDVEVLVDLGTEQQIIERETDIIKRIRINGHEAILHVRIATPR